MGITGSSAIAIATWMLYPKWYRGKLRSIKHTDKIRGDLALQTVQEAIHKGYQVVVIERKSSKTFRKELSSIPGLHVYHTKSVNFSEAKRRAIKYASKLSNVEVIVFTEPEKFSFVTDCIPQVTKPVLKGEAEIVIPKRQENLFKKTYPDYMYESEIEGNALYNEMLRANKLLGSKDESLDMFFGPRVIKNDKEITDLFMRKFTIKVSHFSFPKHFFDTEGYSNSQYFPIILALAHKKKVISITVPFIYPEIQKNNEVKGERDLFIEKRKNQRLTLLVQLLYFINYLQNKK